MGADLNLVQRAVVGGLHVVLALGNGAGNAVVGRFVFHNSHLRYIRFETESVPDTVFPTLLQNMYRRKVF